MTAAQSELPNRKSKIAEPSGLDPLRTRAIDEIEKHMQDMRNQADAAQEKLDLLQSTLRFLDQKYLESTNEQLQQLLTEYLRRLSDDERQT